MRSFPISLLLPVFLYAQVSVNEQADKIEALKIELEQARQMRDKVIAKRWEDKQQDVEVRERFNQEYDELKDKLEAKNQEVDRLHSEIQNQQSDAEEAEAQAETERIQFLSLVSALRDQANGLAEPLEKSFPTRIPERIQALNKVLKDAEVRREAPGEVLAELMGFMRNELSLSREISLEHRGFIRADKTPGEGLLLRLGAITSAYRDSKTGHVGLLLKNAPSTGGFSSFDWREDLPLPTAEALAQSMEILEKGSGSPVGIPMDVLLTQSAVKSYTHVTKKSFWEKITRAVKTGGLFMWPLMLIPFAVLGIFFRKLLQLLRSRAGRSLQAPALAKIEQGDVTGAGALCSGKPENLVLRAMGAVASMGPGMLREQAEKAVRELMLREVPRLERHLTTLSVFAAAAPLLGLLGTVSGLIAMFQVITEHGVNDPKLLAGGIGEALIATETGLLIAIPTLLGHNFLANRVDDLVSEAEYHALRALNALWPKG